MTNKEAIKILDAMGASCEGYSIDEVAEALNMAIKALEFQNSFAERIAEVLVKYGYESMEDFCEKNGIEIDKENEE